MTKKSTRTAKPGVKNARKPTRRPVAPALSKFEFISDDRLRKGLQSDYDEMQTAIACGMWKAVHILAGGILEAVLCDFLLAVDYQNKTGISPAKLDLGRSIDACFAEGALSSKSKGLASAIREYRNLIHPGLALRLEEEVSAGTSKAVEAVLELAIADVTKKKAEIYGFSAEQIVTKLEIDRASAGILHHLLQGIRPQEIERLLLRVIPERFGAINFDTVSPHFVGALRSCFEVAFNLAPEETKRRVAERFAAIVREGSDTEVIEYQNTFFRSFQLDFMEEADRSLVKARVLARLKDEKDELLFQSALGIEKFLCENEKLVYLDFLVRCIFWGNTGALKTASLREVGVLSRSLTESEQFAVWQRLAEWQAHFKKHGLPDVAERVGTIRAEMMAGPMSKKLFGALEALLDIATKKSKQTASSGS